MKRGTWFQVVMVILSAMLLPLATGCETVKPSEYPETSVLLTYIDTNNGFSISYPRDWELVPKDLLSDKDIVGFWIPEAENKGKPIFSMSKQECPTDASPDKYFQTLEVVLQGSPAYDYQFISKDDLTINGSAAIRHTFAYMRGEERLKAMQIYLVKSGSAWIMTCLCSPEFFDSFKSAFDTMSGSLRVF
jgi:hypothetical protein